jgi:NADH-quinone oxidoreductase subunit G
MHEDTTMISLTIDDQKITVPKGTTVYTASKKLDIKIPIFCYQDRMPPFGACRVCMVEVDGRPKPQTSCTLEATEGMVVKTQSNLAVKSRQEILEFLLINHPLDCPICDRAGECPLQDQVVEFGPGESRFYEEKRHFKKPIPLGPVLMLDRERCIACARCTRFCDIVSGDHALELIDRGYRTEVGTPEGGPAESKFIGNTIQICPVGALTSRVYRFRARPWDNKPTETTCTLCPVGCSMIIDERDGEIVRTRSCVNPAINDMWLCDKGWFGYEFASHPDRLKHPLIRKNDAFVEATWEEALGLIVEKMKMAESKGKIAGLGGNVLTVEESYLFQKLMRHSLGVGNVDHRIGGPLVGLAGECLPPGMEMPIKDCAELAYGAFLGVDITEEYPVIWLRVKQSIDLGAPIAFFGNYQTEVFRNLSQVVLHDPGKELEIIRTKVKAFVEGFDKNAKGALFIGRQYLKSPLRKVILEELLKLKSSLPNLSLNLMEGSDNSYGARFAGMHPEIESFGTTPTKRGLNSSQILDETIKSGWDYLHVAGMDLATKMPVKEWKKVRENLGFLVVQDIFLTETARHADVVLPTLCYVEKEGSFINIEGSVQRIRPGKDLPEGVRSDGAIFASLAEHLGMPISVDYALLEELARGKINIRKKSEGIGTQPHTPVPQMHNSLKAVFAPSLFDRGVRMKHNAHLGQSAKDPRIHVHPHVADRFKLENGERIRVSSNGLYVTGKVKVCDSVAEETVVIPLGFQVIPAHELGVELFNGMPVEIRREE